jgi:hypothetical protein
MLGTVVGHAGTKKRTCEKDSDEGIDAAWPHENHTSLPGAWGPFQIGGAGARGARKSAADAAHGVG